MLLALAELFNLRNRRSAYSSWFPRILQGSVSPIGETPQTLIVRRFWASDAESPPNWIVKPNRDTLPSRSSYLGIHGAPIVRQWRILAYKIIDSRLRGYVWLINAD